MNNIFDELAGYFKPDTGRTSTPPAPVNATPTAPQYIISPITTYHEDQMLWETKIGLVAENMPLLYSAWGATEQDSRDMATLLVKLMMSVEK